MHKNSLGEQSNLIVITSSGLKKLDKNVKVEKGWSKQIKLESQLQALKNKVDFIVGTPNRICKLFEIGGLFASNLHYVIIDASFKTVKNFNIFDQFDTRPDLFQLFRTHLQDAVISKQAKIVLM